jgi:hypothetical protein
VDVPCGVVQGYFFHAKKRLVYLGFAQQFELLLAARQR